MPEEPRVHMGRFIDKQIEEIAALTVPLLKAGTDDLQNDWRGLPWHSAERTINGISNRCRLAKVG